MSTLLLNNQPRIVRCPDNPRDRIYVFGEGIRVRVSGWIYCESCFDQRSVIEAGSEVVSEAIQADRNTDDLKLTLDRYKRFLGFPRTAASR